MAVVIQASRLVRCHPMTRVNPSAERPVKHQGARKGNGWGQGLKGRGMRGEKRCPMHTLVMVLLYLGGKSLWLVGLRGHFHANTLFGITGPGGMKAGGRARKCEQGEGSEGNVTVHAWARAGDFFSPLWRGPSEVIRNFFLRSLRTVPVHW